MTKTTRQQPTQAQVAAARQYNQDLTDEDLQYFWKHYTTGKGAGIFRSVKADSTFEEYLVNSAAESEFERSHDY